LGIVSLGSFFVDTLLRPIGLFDQTYFDYFFLLWMD
jgi:hypothetical protein